METNQYRKQEEEFGEYIKECIIKSISNISNIFTIRQSSNEEDTKFSFDMIFSCNMKVSVRLRKNQYKIYKDITIRSKSKYGGRTEINKLYDGEGDIFFYGWLDISESYITQWIIFKIDPIRKLLYDNGTERTNYDGTRLKAYSFSFLNNNNAIISMGRNGTIKILGAN